MPDVSGYLSIYDERVGRYIVVCEVREYNQTDDLIMLWGKLAVIPAYFDNFDRAAPQRFRLTIGHLRPESFTGYLAGFTPSLDTKYVEIEIRKLEVPASGRN